MTFDPDVATRGTGTRMLRLVGVWGPSARGDDEDDDKSVWGPSARGDDEDDDKSKNCARIKLDKIERHTIVTEMTTTTMRTHQTNVSKSSVRIRNHNL